jgi:hypothetical protein
MKIAGFGASFLIISSLMLQPDRAEGAASRLVTGVDTNSSSPHVKTFSAQTQTMAYSFFAYGTSFSGGVRVASGDINGDGATDIITGAGPGGAPHVKVFSGRDSAEIGSFLAYDASFAGGVFVAAGDVNGDGRVDLITGADSGAGPQVKVFSGSNFEVLHSFFAYSAGFQGGVRVASGDVNDDGFADIITGAGAGGGPHVKVFDGTDGKELASFFAYPSTFAGGVYVAAGDVNGDGVVDIITGAGAGAGPHVKVFDGADRSELASFFAFDVGFTGGVRVAAGDVNGDGMAELMVGPGSGAWSTVRVLNAMNQQELSAFTAYDASYQGGVFVAVGSVVHPVLQIERGRLGTSLVLSWPVGEICTLELTEDLANPRGWQAATTQPEETGKRMQVEVPVGATPVYYRLNCDEEAISPHPR